VAAKRKRSKAARKPAIALNRTFGPNLKRCREAAGLTQEDLAHLAGLHPTYVSLLERGKRNPGFGITVKLIGALEIEPGELYKGGTWVPPDIGRKGRFEYGAAEP
jgi:transcriptional regulator with XRE-family HTH domain